MDSFTVGGCGVPGQSPPLFIRSTTGPCCCHWLFYENTLKLYLPVLGAQISVHESVVFASSAFVETCEAVLPPVTCPSPPVNAVLMLNPTSSMPRVATSNVTFTTPVEMTCVFLRPSPPATNFASKNSGLLAYSNNEEGGIRRLCPTVGWRVPGRIGLVHVHDHNNATTTTTTATLPPTTISSKAHDHAP